MDSEELLHLAKLGDPSAQLELSKCYYWGKNGLCKDPAAALNWAEKAASHGSHDACFQLAFFCQNGVGCEPDIDRALYYYTRSAQAGNAKAQFNLGVMYLKEDSIKHDPAAGIHWLEKAAEQEFPQAQLLLGKLCTSPTDSVDPDFSKGAYWLEKAANHGNAEAQLLIGALYLDGKGVEQDTDKARAWVARSANQGNYQAFFSLRLIDQMSQLEN